MLILKVYHLKRIQVCGSNFMLLLLIVIIYGVDFHNKVPGLSESSYQGTLGADGRLIYIDNAGTVYSISGMYISKE